VRGVLRNWGLVFVGNFCGAFTVAMMAAIVCTFGFTSPPDKVGVALGHIGESRTVGYAAHGAAGMLTLFIRGVLCNWMVSAGVVGAMISTTVPGKVIAMWMPIMLFFAMTCEHSIVNMFLFPVGLLLEQLTTDHRVVVSSEQTYLGRALGIASEVEIDYRAVELDVLVLATDGVYEHVEPRAVVQAIRAANDLDGAARRIVEAAYEQGSPDNLTIQIVRIDARPDGEAVERLAQTDLPLPPLLEPGVTFDGYRIVCQLHGSSRSQVYLAVDTAAPGEPPVALKIPSLDLRDDPAYLRRFVMEEWVARRLDNPHVLKARPAARPRNFLYSVAENLDGRTLGQWMTDHPRPDLEIVRGIVEQIA
jgi:hypothetical protein